jgi:hypothetical protein
MPQQLQQVYDLVQFVKEHKIPKKYLKKLGSKSNKKNAMEKALEFENRLVLVAIKIKRAMDFGPLLFYRSLRVALGKTTEDEYILFFGKTLPSFFDKDSDGITKKNSDRIEKKIIRILVMLTPDTSRPIEDPVLYAILEKLEMKALSMATQAAENYKANLAREKDSDAATQVAKNLVDEETKDPQTEEGNTFHSIPRNVINSSALFENQKKPKKQVQWADLPTEAASCSAK